MCEFLRHYLSLALDTLVEIWDNSARLSGSDTISWFPQRINIPLAPASLLGEREVEKEIKEKETQKLVKGRFGLVEFLL